MKKYSKIVCLALSIGMVLGLSNVAKADGHSVMFASWGGSFQDALRSSMLAPAAADLGIEVKEDTTNGIQDIRAQISANAVAWDVAEMELSACETLSRDGMLEPIDYKMVDASGIPSDLRQDNYIGFINFTKVIAYRKDQFGDNGPQSWADFWDV